MKTSLVKRTCQNREYEIHTRTHACVHAYAGTKEQAGVDVDNKHKART